MVDPMTRKPRLDMMEESISGPVTTPEQAALVRRGKSIKAALLRLIQTIKRRVK